MMRMKKMMNPGNDKLLLFARDRGSLKGVRFFARDLKSLGRELSSLGRGR